MGKLPFLAAVILLSMPLHAEAFLSNALGQDLGPLDALTGSGYEGERDGARTVIYSDGEVIRERVDDGNGGYVITDGDTVETVTAEDGQRMLRRVENPDGIHEYRYSYRDGRLSSVTYSVDGELVSITEYVETPSGHLAGLSGTEEGYFTPDYYLYIKDGEAIKAEYHQQGRPAEGVPAGYVLSDDGTWHGTSLVDGREVARVYSSDGLLLSESDGDILMEYAYDDGGNVVSSRRHEGDTVHETEFLDGERHAERLYENGMLLSERTAMSDGRIEEIRYRDGNAYARILFDRDGLRVLEVENL